MASSRPADDNETAVMRMPTPIMIDVDDPGTPVAAQPVSHERIAGSELLVIARTLRSSLASCPMDGTMIVGA